ncbi:hypothetical protein C2G38_368105 [Gigaspora rosea]|uniref:BTB domain-containing protein n=1 Tax=Gigaspora rosea TaxID=44941 RepID=A0A397VXA7_9GLOM|nr:hypothetical protein C2G38_368105 [Gigaspora rosea]
MSKTSKKLYGETLIQDFIKFFEEDNNYDLEIKVGEEPNIKIFRGHSQIFIARSSYFKSAFTREWVKKTNGIINFEKPNISPEIFEIIIRYIYTGIIQFENSRPDILIELLIAFDELNIAIDYVMDDIQEYLLRVGFQWIRENFVYVYKIGLQHDRFKKLNAHIDDIIQYEPEVLLESQDFIELEESELLPILKRDDFSVKDEAQIWDRIIQWGCAKQNPTLSTDPSKWSEENIESMRSTLKNFIPLVRFFTLNSDKFHKHVRPYEKILGDVYEQVLQYHLVKVWKPKGIEILPRRNIVYSKLLRHNHVKEIKKQIYLKNYIRSYPTKDPYDLVLLEPYQYESLCLCPTITVFRIPELDLIIGGYNPFQTKHYKILYPPSLKLKAESSFMFRIIGKKIEFISALGTRDFDLKSHYITPLNIFDFKFHGINRKISYRQHFYHSLLNYSHSIYKNSYDIEGLQVFEVIEKIY